MGKVLLSDGTAVSHTLDRVRVSEPIKFMSFSEKNGQPEVILKRCSQRLLRE
jgi:hypothetical protein